MNRRILVAGVGNIFLGDDAFGVEVAQRLAHMDLPDGVRVEDFGIRGMHLAYELLEGYDQAILVDAAPRGGTPGDLYVIEPEAREASVPSPSPGEVVYDAHGMEPGSVLSMLETLGGEARVLVVGCEPADTSERMGLSEPVAAAVERAIPMIVRLLVGDSNGNGTRAGVGASTDGKEEM